MHSIKDAQKLHLAAKDGGHAIELSGTILAMAARLPRPCGRRSLFEHITSISLFGTRFRVLTG